VEIRSLILNQTKNDAWLGLMIGNSRSHWGLFIGETLNSSGDTDHLSPSEIQQLTRNSPALAILLASVVPSQTAYWLNYPHTHLITLDQIPLKGMYPTLGIDRALALWGAGKTWGFPILVIDAGTALTFTGGDHNRCLVGGAILPGLGLQMNSLGEKTGQLPFIETGLITDLPPRFALNTPEAIQSGVIYTLLSGIKDFITAWWDLFPESKIVITGGDGYILHKYLNILYAKILANMIVENNLIFWGMRELVNF
jgi:type III pantothenate kinase